MKAISNTLLIFSLKVLAVLAFVYYTNAGFLHRIHYLNDTENYVTLVVFTALWVFSILVLLSVSFQQNIWVRVFWAIVIAFTTAVSYGFYAAGGSELEVLDVLELWQARHETGRAFEHFRHALIQACIVAFIGFVILAFPAPKVSNKTRKILSLIAWLPILPILLFSTLIFVKSDKAVAGLPQQFTPAAMATAITYKVANHEIPTRKNVENVPENPAKAKHLLYLVDESVNPEYIYNKDKTLLQGFADNQNKIADFGVSVSGSNCSARSNAILRLGATRNNLISSIKTNPSIWQYAKKAGFRTVYIDSQSSGNVATKPNDFQNYMTTEEAKFIDKFYKIKNVPAPELDYRLLQLVIEEFNNELPTFIYANKNGAHFPYNYNYPKSEAIYQPELAGKEDDGLGELLGLYESDKNMTTVINSYKNSIHWNVDKFFRRFFNQVDLNNTLVLYTADHGQYFKPGATTHCTSGEGAPVVEGLVPLMIMTSNNELLNQYRTAASQNYNVTDHFSLFPTVLNLFGYSKQIQNSYGAGLLDPLSDANAAFNTGDILGIISADTIWRSVSKTERLNPK